MSIVQEHLPVQVHYPVQFRTHKTWLFFSKLFHHLLDVNYSVSIIRVYGASAVHTLLNIMNRPLSIPLTLTQFGLLEVEVFSQNVTDLLLESVGVEHEVFRLVDHRQNAEDSVAVEGVLVHDGRSSEPGIALEIDVILEAQERRRRGTDI